MAGQDSLHSNKTFKYEALIENKIGRGASGVVFRGFFKPFIDRSWRRYGEKTKAAIKRVELHNGQTINLDIDRDREVIALRTLSHPCIVTLLAVEDDQDFRNFVFELCEATLEDYIAEKYVGPMPDKIQGLFHMASGLKFIHEKRMIHRDIKPENVLISISKNGEVRLKISDLGFTKQLQDDGSHFDMNSGLKGTEYYMAPELLRLRNQRENVLNSQCTTATDVFAAGITFFRFLFKGFHPFGTGYRIESNIMGGNPINLSKENRKFQSLINNLIKPMIHKDSTKRLSTANVVDQLKRMLGSTEQPNFSNSFSSLTLENSSANAVKGQEAIIVRKTKHDSSLTIGEKKLEIKRNTMISKGLYGAVFQGKFENKNVAVKRVQKIDFDDKHHEKTLGIFQELKDHPNVLHLMYWEQDSNFRYYVLEFCDISLPNLINNPEKYEKSMLLTDEQVLFQLTCGLDYIHSKKITHYIHPDHVLISLTEPIQMKWSGFISSKRTDKLGKCPLGSGFRGTQMYLAPEIILMMMNGKSNGQEQVYNGILSNIFSAGCVFFYFLTRGVHPFEKNDGKIHTNIVQENPKELKNIVKDKHFAHQFIMKMIEKLPTKRIKLGEVIKYLEPLQTTKKGSVQNRLSSILFSHQNEISKGSYSKVYRVSEFEGMTLAVKKVDVNYMKGFSQEKFKKLKELNHVNVIRLHFFDQDNLVCYFGMELCTTSLDRLYLPDGDPKKYSGPMPTIKDEEFCVQLARGLQYIHDKKLIHGSIKPSNILISIDNKVAQMKLSDFGLRPASERTNEGNSSSPRNSGFQGSAYWWAPEIIQQMNQENGKLTLTKESDIFSTGSVLFYFASRGYHLYGDEIHNIIPNTLAGKQENLIQKLPSNLFPMGLIRYMTAKEPENRPDVKALVRHSESLLPIPKKLKTVGEIQYSTKHVIGAGGQATVFVGYFQGSTLEVAVKPIGNMDAISDNEKDKVYGERDSFEQLKHENIVELLGSAEKGSFLLLALEKCLTSLDAYCRKPLLYRGIVPMPPDAVVLLQLAEGLQYIHQQNIIHRDVKPANILISYDKPAVIKWGDFGMSRAVTTGSRTFTWSNLKGTERWMAPELIEANESDKVSGSFKCDIFALGCVFFFFLVPGKHPFGDDLFTVSNIKNGNRILLHKLEKNFAYKIVKQMTEKDRHSRPDFPKIIKELRSFLEKVPDNQEVEMEDVSNNTFRPESDSIPNQFDWSLMDSSPLGVQTEVNFLPPESKKRKD